MADRPDFRRDILPRLDVQSVYGLHVVFHFNPSSLPELHRQGEVRNSHIDSLPQDRNPSGANW